MSSILLPLGGMTTALGVWIALWDIRNEFLPWLLGAGLLMLGLGMVFE
jgi:hypothetical protein